METTIMGYMGTSIRIHFLIPREQKVSPGLGGLEFLCFGFSMLNFLSLEFGVLVVEFAIQGFGEWSVGIAVVIASGV